MKTSLQVLIGCLLVSSAHAEFRTWTRNDGKNQVMLMQWPQLKLSKTEKFKTEFKHPDRGIPNLVLTNLEDRLLMTGHVGGDARGPLLS